MKPFCLSFMLLFALGLTCCLCQTVSVKQCTDDKECDVESECCLIPDYRKGKRNILGTCSPLKAQGSYCTVKTFNPPVHYSCDCVRGLSCIGTGMFEIPQGEIGRCG